jgi:hypothetical protein
LTVYADGSLHFSDPRAGRDERRTVSQARIRSLQEALTRPEWQEVAFYGQPVPDGFTITVQGGDKYTGYAIPSSTPVELPPILAEVLSLLNDLWPENDHWQPIEPWQETDPLLREPAAEAPASLEPRLVELRGEDTLITYSTNSGEQQLTYQGSLLTSSRDQQKLTLSGEEIRPEDLEIGTMIHVLLESASSGDYMLDLLLPNFYPNLSRSKEWRFDTLAILTRVEGGIVPPNLRTGAVQSYQVLGLQGTARLVEL